MPSELGRDCRNRSSQNPGIARIGLTNMIKIDPLEFVSINKFFLPTLIAVCWIISAIIESAPAAS